MLNTSFMSRTPTSTMFWRSMGQVLLITSTCNVETITLQAAAAGERTTQLCLNGLAPHYTRRFISTAAQYAACKTIWKISSAFLQLCQLLPEVLEVRRLGDGVFHFDAAARFAAHGRTSSAPPNSTAERHFQLSEDDMTFQDHCKYR